MKEVHIKVSNISQRQWISLLIELNLVKSAWRRFGPELNIKAKDFYRIIKWGRKTHGENTDNINSTFRRHRRRGKIRTK